MRYIAENKSLLPINLRVYCVRVLHREISVHIVLIDEIRDGGLEGDALHTQELMQHVRILRNRGDEAETVECVFEGRIGEWGDMGHCRSRFVK